MGIRCLRSCLLHARSRRKLLLEHMLPPDSTLVVDGEGWLYSQFRDDPFLWLTGGDLVALAERITLQLQEFQRAGVQVTFFFDGQATWAKTETRVQRRRDRVRAAGELLENLRHAHKLDGWAASQQVTLPPLAKAVAIEQLLNVGAGVVQCLGESDLAMARYCLARGCTAVLTDDSDFFLMGVPVITLKSLVFRNSRAYGELCTPQQLQEFLGLPSSEFAALAALSGNDFVSEELLRPLHNTLPPREVRTGDVDAFFIGLARKVAQLVAAHGSFAPPRHPKEGAAVLTGELLRHSQAAAANTAELTDALALALAMFSPSGDPAWLEENYTEMPSELPGAYESGLVGTGLAQIVLRATLWCEPVLEPADASGGVYRSTRDFRLRCAGLFWGPTDIVTEYRRSGDGCHVAEDLPCATSTGEDYVAYQEHTNPEGFAELFGLVWGEGGPQYIDAASVRRRLFLCIVPQEVQNALADLGEAAPPGLLLLCCSLRWMLSALPVLRFELALLLIAVLAGDNDESEEEGGNSGERQKKWKGGRGREGRIDLEVLPRAVTLVHWLQACAAQLVLAHDLCRRPLAGFQPLLRLRPTRFAAIYHKYLRRCATGQQAWRVAAPQLAGNTPEVAPKLARLLLSCGGLLVSTDRSFVAEWRELLTGFGVIDHTRAERLLVATLPSILEVRVATRLLFPPLPNRSLHDPAAPTTGRLAVLDPRYFNSLAELDDLLRDSQVWNALVGCDNGQALAVAVKNTVGMHLLPATAEQERPLILLVYPDAEEPAVVFEAVAAEFQLQQLRLELSPEELNQEDTRRALASAGCLAVPEGTFVGICDAGWPVASSTTVVVLLGVPALCRALSALERSGPLGGHSQVPFAKPVGCPPGCRVVGFLNPVELRSAASAERVAAHCGSYLGADALAPLEVLALSLRTTCVAIQRLDGQLSLIAPGREQQRHGLRPPYYGRTGTTREAPALWSAVEITRECEEETQATLSAAKTHCTEHESGSEGESGQAHVSAPGPALERAAVGQALEPEDLPLKRASPDSSGTDEDGFVLCRGDPPPPSLAPSETTTGTFRQQAPPPLRSSLGQNASPQPISPAAASLSRLTMTDTSMPTEADDRSTPSTTVVSLCDVGPRPANGASSIGGTGANATSPSLSSRSTLPSTPPSPGFFLPSTGHNSRRSSNMRDGSALLPLLSPVQRAALRRGCSHFPPACVPVPSALHAVVQHLLFCQPRREA